VLLEITYRTEYHYDPPVRDGLSAVRLLPSARPGLEVLSRSLRASPGKVAFSYVDGWGTAVDVVDVSGVHGSAMVEARARVRTFSAEHDEPPRPDEVRHFTRGSARVPLDAATALGWNVGSEGQSWPAVESALQWFPQRFLYRLGATDALTPVEDFIALGAGVCQDFVHAHLALLRSWGWCARYVSGYLFSATGEAASIEADAMHAWTEVYRPGAGWIGLDPTAGTYADDRYVPVGYGRDYADVRPVRGVIRGATMQSQTSRLHMQVSQQQQ